MSESVRVGVLGAAGRMGRAVCAAVEAAPDLVLAAAVDPLYAPGGPGGADVGLDLPSGVLAGAAVELPSGVLAGAAVELLGEARADVVVDFTVAAAARENLRWCASHGIHAVVGTTGLGPDDVAGLGEWFTGHPANAVVAPNFAIGAVLLMRLCELVAPHMDGVEVIELHHDAKRDAPSGTALRTASRLAAARAAAGMPAFPPDRTTETALPGARGGASEGGVRVHSVRLPGLVAHEEVVFGAPGQSLTIRHDSYDRSSFMPGVLLAVRAVAGRPGVTLGLEPLLGLPGA